MMSEVFFVMSNGMSKRSWLDVKPRSKHARPVWIVKATPPPMPKPSSASRTLNRALALRLVLQRLEKRPRSDRRSGLTNNPKKEASVREGLQTSPVYEVPSLEVAPMQLDAPDDQASEAEDCSGDQGHARPAPHPLTRPKDAGPPKQAPVHKSAAAAAMSP